MKIRYFIFFVLGLFLSLNSCKEKKTIAPVKIVSNLPKEKKSSLPTYNDALLKKRDTDKKELHKLNEKELINIRLIGMRLTEDSKEMGVYQKYGLDISSLCYASNLGTIKIKEKNIVISNYDGSSEDTIQLKIESIDFKENKMTITVVDENSLKFTFIKVEDIPVYSLKIVGKINTELYLNNFFTTEKQLPKFDVHDCGDFDG